MERYGAIVIGMGAMGSAAAYHLARRGVRTLGLEQFDIPHDRGSSHGVNRIIRLAYWEDPAYVPLVRRAYDLWRELERTAGERLLIITGGIDAGRPETPTVRGALRSCEVYQIPHEVLDAAELRRRHPGFRLAPEMIAVYQRDAGFVMSERAIAAHAAAARRAGAEIRTREPVLGWEPGAGGVQVRSEHAVYTAERLVITAGSWTGKLIPQIAAQAVPERQVMMWTRPLRPELFQPDRFPVFILEAPEGHFYGLPMYESPGVKFGKHHHRKERTDPDRPDREIHPEDEEALREGIRRYFPDADGPAAALTTCMYTNSPDRHFILDCLPGHPEVAVAAGFSGHGYKFASVIGEIMADLATEGTSRHDLALFRLARFAG